MGRSWAARSCARSFLLQWGRQHDCQLGNCTRSKHPTVGTLVNVVSVGLDCPGPAPSSATPSQDHPDEKPEKRHRRQHQRQGDDLPERKPRFRARTVRKERRRRPDDLHGAHRTDEDQRPEQVPDPPCHPVRRRPTHRGAGLPLLDKLERPTGRTSLASRGRSARLCLGRRWSGWPPSPKPERPRRRQPLQPSLWVRTAAPADAGRSPPAGRARAVTVRRARAALDPVKVNSAVVSHPRLAAGDRDRQRRA